MYDVEWECKEATPILLCVVLGFCEEISQMGRLILKLLGHKFLRYSFWYCEKEEIPVQSFILIQSSSIMLF